MLCNTGSVIRRSVTHIADSVTDECYLVTVALPGWVTPAVRPRPQGKPISVAARVPAETEQRSLRILLSVGGWHQARGVSGGCVEAEFEGCRGRIEAVYASWRLCGG